MTVDTIPGSRVRDNHKLTVLGVVGKDLMIPVVSGGSRFMMVGKFPWSIVSSNLGNAPLTFHNIKNWLAGAGSIQPGIYIAETPTTLTRRTYLALMGGAMHEAWHRLYTKQGDLDPVLAMNTLNPHVAGVDWQKYRGLLLQFANVIEDINIERIGNVEFPGAYTKMCDLADFILDMESTGRAKSKAPVPPGAVAMMVIREYGLGYNTDKTQAALAYYRKVAPKVVEAVLTGSLSGLLNEAIPDVSTPAAVAQAKQDLLNGKSTVLAMKIVKVLLGMLPPPPPPQQSDSGEGGEKGDRQPSKGKPSKDQKKSEGDKSEGDKSGDKSEGDESEGDESGDESEGDESGDESEGDKSEGDESEGDESEGDESEEGDGSSENQTSDTETPAGNPQESEKPSAGGVAQDEGKTLADILKDLLNGASAMDAGKALEEAVAKERAKEKKDLSKGEMPYRPFSTANDREEVVRKGSARQIEDYRQVLENSRKATAFVRARLGMMFRGLEEGQRDHGVRRGPVFSERMLVNTVSELRGGRDPSQAFAEDSVTMDMSLAACTIIDESGSMSGKVSETAQIVHALNVAIETIGAKSMVVGFRDDCYGSNSDPNLNPYGATRQGGFHRSDPVIYDIFKDWTDTWQGVSSRMVNLHATGGTPMADGVEYGLQELSDRREAHRVMFVVTDGEPNWGHLEVMKGQIRRATEAGILVVGVGLGLGSEYVNKAFPDSVYHANLDELAPLLVKKLEEILRRRGTSAKRGKQVKG